MGHLNSFTRTVDSCHLPWPALESIHVDLRVDYCSWHSYIHTLALYSVRILRACERKIKLRLLTHYVTPLCVSIRSAADTHACLVYFLRQLWHVSPNWWKRAETCDNLQSYREQQERPAFVATCCRNAWNWEIPIVKGLSKQYLKI